MVLCLAASVAALAEKALPLPRFAALRSDQVNLRAGPGDRYPIEWVFLRKELPVEIVQEWEHWRKIRDSEGTEGWVHQRMLVGKRFALVTGETRALHERPQPGAAVVARAEPGVVARLLECEGAWCRIEAGKIEGWIRRNEIWGVYPAETLP
jgi:SH3-like domain-containing protein